MHLHKRRPSTWQEALEQFLWFKQAQNLSPRTIEGYGRDISLFFTRNPEAYQPGTLRESALAYMADKVKPATFNLRLTYLKAFFDWGVGEGIFDENPLAGIKRRRAEARKPSILTGCDEARLCKEYRWPCHHGALMQNELQELRSSCFPLLQAITLCGDTQQLRVQMDLTCAFLHSNPCLQKPG